MSNNTETIKSIVKKLLPSAKVILFGSRARGNFSDQSDYDVLIITPDQPDNNLRKSIITTLSKELVKALRAPVDVLLNSEAEVTEKMKLPGHIIRWAVKEGVQL